MTHVARAFAALAAILAAATTLSCFEQPVTETLSIAFDGEGAMKLEVVTRITLDKSATENPAAAARLDNLRDAIARGDDAWGRAARRLEPDMEKDTFEYHGGVLHEASKDILVEDPEKIGLVFTESPLNVFLEEREDLWTLEIVPGASDRATPRQARAVNEGLDRSGASIAAYVEAVADLYERLEADPGRSRDCFGAIFEDLTKVAPRKDALDEKETALVKAVKDRMADVFGILSLAEGEEYTLDELSHLAYDPFPAPMEIEVPAAPEEVVGFQPRGERAFAARGPGFWEALSSLRGRWVDPDPVLIYVEEMRREGGPKFDLDAFLAGPRSVRGRPAGEAVRRALEEHLRPAERYLLRWRLPSKPEETAGGTPPGGSAILGGTRAGPGPESPKEPEESAS